MMMSAQLVSIFIMFMSGIAVGAVIDGVRISLQFFGVHRLVFLLEWLMWGLLGICTFYFLFLIKGGEWRVVDPLAQIAGIISYELLFQKIFRLVGRFFVNSIIKPFYFIGHLFVQVVRKIIIILVRLIKILVGPIHGFFSNILSNAFQKKR